jgi:ABC-2 type transport system ATP-binding protein
MIQESDIAVRCRGLVKRYADVVAVNGLDLAVRRGECFGLLGPNGAGKTTTIEILEGLTPPDAGEVEILGGSWANDSRRLRERMGISLQETQLNDKLTIQETVRLFASFYERGRDPDEVIAKLALEEKRNARVGKLSGGQKQRLAVACALVGDPEVLFLDEPTTGLDPQSRIQLWDQVMDFRAHGGTVLLTTHYMDEAERLCDRVAIVDHGRVIALGSPRELKQRSGGNTRIEVKLARPATNGTLQNLEGVVDAREVAGAYVLHTQRPPQAIVSLVKHLEAEGNELVSLEIATPSLEDVFIEMTGRRLRD